MRARRLQVRTAGMDVIGIGAVFFVAHFAEALGAHHVREAEDGIERCADFMADAGKEIGFLRRCGFRQPPRLPKLLFGPLPAGFLFCGAARLSWQRDAAQHRPLRTHCSAARSAGS